MRSTIEPETARVELRCLAVTILLVFAASAFSAELVTRGLAAKYPGDAEIEKDSNVLFVENFEEPSLEALKKRWETVSHPEIMSFTDDVPEGGRGKESFLMTHIGGKGDGGHLYRRLVPGHDKLYARF